MNPIRDQSLRHAEIEKDKAGDNNVDFKSDVRIRYMSYLVLGLLKLMSY